MASDDVWLRELNNKKEGWGENKSILNEMHKKNTGYIMDREKQMNGC